MSHLMLVNPSKKKKRRASPKQLAALRKARAARKGIKTKRRRVHRSPVAIVKRRRRSKRAAGSAFRTRHFKRNPDKFSVKGFVKNSLMPSAIGAGGALGLDLAMAMLPLPPMLKTDTIRPFVRVAGAVGLGIIGGMVAGKRMGESIGSGALTVVLYDELKKIVKKVAPTLPLGDEYPSIEYVSPGMIAAYDDDSMGQYVGGGGIAVSADDEMGEYVI